MTCNLQKTANNRTTWMTMGDAQFVTHSAVTAALAMMPVEGEGACHPLKGGACSDT
jgi:hypothetical protein